MKTKLLTNNLTSARIKQAFNLFIKSKTFTLKVITNPYLISSIISFVIIINLPIVFQKYKAEILSREKITPDVTYYYADLNGDGISEKIEFRQIRENFLALTVYDMDKVIDQWNFEGKYIRSWELVTAKVDSISLRSIYFLSFGNDKLFLNCLNPFLGKVIAKKKFVADYVPFDAKDLDLVFNPCTVTNQKRKGIKEFYFSLSVGYSKQPRRIFKYDPSIDSVFSSCFSYAAIPYPAFADTSMNNFKLLIASCAYGNSTNKDPYSDMSAWLMCYDKNLKFFHDPIRIGIYPSQSDIVPINVGGKTFYVCSNMYNGTKMELSSFRLFDSNLRLIKQKKFPYVDNWGITDLHSCEDQSHCFYMIKQNGKIDKYDENLELVSTFSLPPLFSSYPIDRDLDGDNENEHIFISNDMDKLLLVRNDFSSYTIVKCEKANTFWNFSVDISRNGDRTLAVLSNNEKLTLSYQLNYLYYLKYPFYAGIYMVVLVFIFLIQKSQKHRAELKYKAEKKIAELQLKAIKNQIDPHFTLNIVNSIGSLSYKQDREQADYIFGKYSKLLRSTVLNSDKIITTLADELDYVENYLELEKFRCNNKFTWKLDISEKVNTDIQIPKMLLHTFVENSIKHGIKNLGKPGEISISINNSSTEYNVTIRDNGVGREKAKSEIESTGKGLSILEQILSLYYELTKIKITYQLEDIVDVDENSIGTKALIKISVG